MTENGVAGLRTKATSSEEGMRSKSALTMVQFRPPNFGTANVYGKRMSAPMRPGTATSVKSWSVVYAKPILGNRGATMLHISQTENPICSARIDQKRLRRATNRPSVSQNVSFSGFQFAIHRDMALFLFGRLL